ncbi:MAG: DPP IV N-terminal domain-containing protein [Bacteroidales bacterium]|nr:DPP IV N-terminal domain-containing protein [Bacteroidales bacterium]
MKKYLMLTAALFVAVSVFPQQQRLRSDQLMDRSLYPSTPYRNVQCVGKGSQVAYTRGDTLFFGTVLNMRPIMTLQRLNKLFKDSGLEHTFDYMPAISFINEREFDILLAGERYRYSIPRRTLTKLYDHRAITNASNGDIAPNTYYYAYTVNNDLKVAVVNQTKTFEGKGDDIIYGQSVHRNEFGIEKGTFWSPNGTRLAFYRLDQSMVTDYPRVNTHSRIATSTPFKYPMAGMKSHEVTVGIYDTRNDTTIYLNTRNDTSVAEREMYLTNISWSPDEQTIYIARINREQNHLWLESYDATSGDRRNVLFEEQDERYVEPLHGLYFIPHHDNEFLWISRRNGYNHIYHYSTDGTLLGQLTQGEYEVEDIVGFDEKGLNVFYYANRESAIGRQAYKTNIASGETTLLTTIHGTHSIAINQNGTMLIDYYSNTDTPTAINIVSGTGRVKKELYTATNPLDDYAMPTITLGTIKAANGATDLHYRLITPPDLDSSKRYPTLVYVYGGPHSQLVTDSWLGGANLYFLYLAQQGYVVFTLDNRGTSNRGMAFESCTHRHLGQNELADQMEGVKYLQSLPFVDKERMGVEGWSFGGFMTITMKLAHPEIFKVACAGGPVIDWKWYEVMYGERYMDTPQENPDGYAANSLLDKAGQLEGRLLVIHGAEDPVVMWQNSLEFIDACIQADKQVDYFVYPHHEHNVIGHNRLHLYKKMFDYYETFLK